MSEARVTSLQRPRPWSPPLAVGRGLISDECRPVVGAAGARRSVPVGACAERRLRSFLHRPDKAIAIAPTGLNELLRLVRCPQWPGGRARYSPRSSRH